MKFIIFLVLAGGIGMLLLPVLEKNEQFKSVSREVTQQFKSVSQEVTEQFRSTVNSVTGPTSGGDKYYRWQDSDGSWHFGDKSSVPTGTSARELSLAELTNILKSVDTSEFMSRLSSSSNNASGDSFDLSETPNSLSLLLNPQQALQTLEEAKKVKAMMESRNQEMEKLFNQ